jgi:hypothetical protein
MSGARSASDRPEVDRVRLTVSDYIRSLLLLVQPESEIGDRAG